MLAVQLALVVIIMKNYLYKYDLQIPSEIQSGLLIWAV